MRCVILAAGASRRLKTVTLGRPKCLLPVGGKPLLQRTIEAVVSEGVTDIAIVTGHRAPEIRSFVGSIFPHLSFTYIHNPSFASTDNLYSLHLARSFLARIENLRQSRGPGSPPVRTGDLLLLDSDILFAASLLRFVSAHRGVNRIAVRVTGPHDEEEIKVKIDRYQRVRVIGKEIPLNESLGESIGIAIFSFAAVRKLVTAMERRVTAGTGRTEYYEAAFQDIINRGVVLKAVDISRFPVAEIDTPQDLRYAERVVLPLIEHA